MQKDIQRQVNKYINGNWQVAYILLGLYSGVAIFSLRLIIFLQNFASLLPIYVHIHLPLLVDLC